jgi:hypothetical protein
VIREIPIGEAWWGLNYGPGADAHDAASDAARAAAMPAPLELQQMRLEGRNKERADLTRAWFRYKAGKHGVGTWYTWDPSVRERPITEAEFEQNMADQKIAPILLSCFDRKKYWIYKDRIYSSDPSLEAGEVQALVDAKELKRQRAIGRARVVVSSRPVTPSAPDTPARLAIPSDVKMFVWQRDGGECVECGSKDELEFDHIIPLSMGGAKTARNLQLLCAPCNQSKGGNLV